MMRVAVIGCGLIGSRRARHLGEHRLIAAADVDMARAESVASQHAGAIASENWKQVVDMDQADLIIVATTPDIMAEITIAALRNGKDVFVDKPAARNESEMEEIAQAAAKYGKQVRVGFNHRFHPAVQRAHEIVTAGGVGKLMYVRGRYGHGARLGYEREWRADAAVSGGGELVDQGMHLIDLSRLFLGDFVSVSGHAATFFWEMPVDDNAFAMLRTAEGQVAWLHASWTEWKNLFCFEIFGQTGKLQIDGLGGSYGVESLTFYKMKPEMGPPEVQQWQFPGEDLSWRTELEEFIADIEAGRTTRPNADDALAVHRIVASIYQRESSMTGRAR